MLFLFLNGSLWLGEVEIAEASHYVSGVIRLVKWRLRLG